MRIVDVCAFYTPAGGGVRTYVDRKLKAVLVLATQTQLLSPRFAQAILATFPCGSVTGAPKRAAIRRAAGREAMRAALRDMILGSGGIVFLVSEDR